jgi:type II secretion system protein D
MIGVVAARLQTMYGADPTVRVTTEPSTGKLMVYANSRIHQDISSRVLALQTDILRTQPANVPVNSNIQRTHKLSHIQPKELEEAIQRLGGPRVMVNSVGNGDIAQIRMATQAGVQDIMQIDRRQGLVTLLGSSANIVAWLQVVSAIDNGKASPDRPTQIIPLAPADPSNVERAFQLVRVSMLQNQQGQRNQPNQEEQTTDAAALTAPQTVPGQDPRIAALSALDGESGLFGDVQIQFVPELGIVIVRGNKRDVQRVLEVVEKIKKQSEETQPEVDVHLLKHVDGQALATIITTLYTDVLAPRQGQVSITALAQPNAILLVGRKEAIASVKDIINKIDQPLDPGSELKVIRLLHASASDAEQTIRSFFVETPGTGTNQRVGLGTRVRVVADTRTNSLIIQASPRDLSEVARLVNEIDVESTSAQSEVQVFRLRNASATELEPILQEAVTGASAPAAGGGGGGGGTSSTSSIPSGRVSIRTAQDGKLVDSGILSGVVITSNASINSLVVRAPSKSMPLIAALIEQLDQAPSAEARIKVFEIRNGDAQSLANTIQQLFGLPTTTAAGQNAGVANLFGLGGLQNQAALTGGGDSSLVPLRVTVDIRTNSIIASGSRSDLEVIEVLLLRLDEDGVRQRRTEVIWLRNNNAQDVAQAIQTFLQQQRQTLQQAGAQLQAIGSLEQFDRDILVVAEPTTNSLIVSATPRYAQEIRNVIERLDRQPPMIYVQILLAEVTLDDTFEFGTEMGLQDSLLFDRGIATGGTLASPVFNLGPVPTVPGRGRPEQLAGQSLSTFGLGRSNDGVGYGGLVLSAANESIGILMRALQDANRLQILSRPHVMTLDNLEAFVQVGQRVPRITGVTAGTFGQTITPTDTDVGLLMRIKPRTNADGLIQMDVYVERSSLGDDATGIPVGFGPNGEVIRSPIINTTNALTKINARDGQTVMFAGLITKTRATRSRRIPYLADIPIAGALFRYDTESENRTELLVVLTPRIIRGPEDTALINDIESSRMSWCLADILNIHGDTTLSHGNGLWGPASSPVIYPDIQPSGMGGEILLQDEHGPIHSSPLPIPLTPGPTPTIESAPYLTPSAYDPNQYQNNVVPASATLRRRN